MTMMENVEEEEAALQSDCELKQFPEEYVKESICSSNRVDGDLSKNSESSVADNGPQTEHLSVPNECNNQENTGCAAKEKPVNRSRHVRSHSDCTDLRSQSDLSFNTSSPSTSLDNSFSSKFEENKKPRFLEDGGSSIVVPAGGHEYPKRKRGQSLLDYLTLNYSSKLSAELDRENAHFSVSEAMITAIEESRFVHWKKGFDADEDDKLIGSDVNEESDEEIRQLRIQLQSERFNNSFSSTSHYRESQASNVHTSISSPISSLGTVTPSLSPSSSITSVIAAIDIQQQGKTPEQQDSGISMSFASMYSAAEKDARRSRRLNRLRKLHSRLSARNGVSSGENTPISMSPSSPMTSELDGSRSSITSPVLSRSVADTSPAVCSETQLPPISESAVSAENIALTLLTHFSQFRVPQESDMEWLVSERDAPQHLLPMPRSWPVNPDEPFMELKENETEDNRVTSLRGNWEWAPPRPQIVFAVYSSPNLKVVMAKQNYRCAGCGMKVAPEYCRSYRYCHYLGRYFCTACHWNKTSVIPSRILKKWDFKKYPVSNFSYDLLERMWFDPLFRLGYINPLLYRRCRQLNKVLELRIQLTHVGEFLKHCRYATEVWDEVKKESADWLDDAEIYSLHDLVRVNTGELFQQLRYIVTRGMKHIIDCELCKARGFLCEKCRSNEIIFPFQVDTVIRCQKCGSCYHIPCWDSNCCTRCQRMARRSQENNDDTH